MTYPRHILMTTPKGFRIAYGINPHMRDADGNLKVVDGNLAARQWQALRDLYARLGFEIHTIEGRDEFPDLVFAANPTFPFHNGDRKGVVLANMFSEFRRAETKIYADWAREHGLEVATISGGCFEGSGDAAWNFGTGEIVGGYGIRTELSVYDQLEKITGAKVHRVKMIDQRFYHLDTCFAVLDGTTAAYVAEAFAPEALETLRSVFPTLLRIDADEGLKSFAGNAFCPDGENVVLQRGSPKFVKDLRALGFIVHEMETGEFIKSGGSVFCTKQQLWV